MNRTDWLNKRILVALVLQLVGYAALSALVPHSDLATVLEPLQRLPTVLLVLVALMAVPAVAKAIALGAASAALGLHPTKAFVLWGRMQHQEGAIDRRYLLVALGWLLVVAPILGFFASPVT